MFQSFAKKVLQRAGYEVTRKPERAEPARPASIIEAESPLWNPIDFASRIAKDPLNANLHLEYGMHAHAKGMPFLAYAEWHTARFLNAKGAQNELALALESQADPFRGSLPDLLGLNHNEFYRYNTLAKELTRRSQGSPMSLLDVGGGQGRLAAFLGPEHSYCLAEPKVNGIFGGDLPFSDGAFDYVVSCHVLEHIPEEDRTAFLDHQLSKARRGMILLNPFEVPKTHVTERLQLFIDITDADWAKEHLDCSLPTVSQLERYAEDRNLEYACSPNGSVATTLACVFMDHFAAQAGRGKDLETVHRFLNQRYPDILDSNEYPNAYLIYLGRKDR